MGMWDQVAGFVSESAQLRHGHNAGKSPAQQMHIWRNCKLSCGPESVCVYVFVDIAGVYHTASVTNEHASLGAAGRSISGQLVS